MVAPSSPLSLGMLSRKPHCNSIRFFCEAASHRRRSLSASHREQVLPVSSSVHFRILPSAAPERRCLILSLVDEGETQLIRRQRKPLPSSGFQPLCQYSTRTRMAAEVIPTLPAELRVALKQSLHLKMRWGPLTATIAHLCFVPVLPGILLT